MRRNPAGRRRAPALAHLPVALASLLLPAAALLPGAAPSAAEVPRAGSDPETALLDLEAKDGDYRRPSEVALVAWWEGDRWRTEPALRKELEKSVPGIRRLSPRDWSGTAVRNPEEYRRALATVLGLYRSGPAGLRPWFLLVADGLAVRLGRLLPDPPADASVHAGEEVGGDTLRYEYDRLGGVWVSRHEPLWLAWTAHGRTPAGERAFVLLSDLAWNTTSSCEDTDGFREVIRRGEEFLAERPGSPVRGEVHGLVARAYETWWSLGLREGREGSRLSPALIEAYREGSSAARDRAMGHYRVAVRVLPPEHPDAAYAARHLDLIVRGIDTRQRAYFCFRE